MERHVNQLVINPNTGTQVPHITPKNPKIDDVYALSSIAHSNDHTNDH